MNHSWQDVCLAAIAVLPGVIAAIVAAMSSLRNGRKLDRAERRTSSGGGVSSPHPESRPKQNGRNLDDGDTASNPDWYKAPDFK